MPETQPIHSGKHNSRRQELAVLHYALPARTTRGLASQGVLCLALFLASVAMGWADSHWAFQPVKRPAPPIAKDHALGPIDLFTNAKREQRGLGDGPEADRTALIRRLYFLMLGLPPTPEEVEAFTRAPAPNAYERLVDKVLADPRYGERWGRHWLDVIRFAETNGFETNRERLGAWRFRDFVIAAFNGDRPFDQFAREQIAGDSLGADVATGFLVGGPVDIVKSPDVALTAQQRVDEIDDMVSTTGTAFLGLTVGCARCHSHKFDPITHREYYSLAAVFAGVEHGERAAPVTPEHEAELARLGSRIQALERNLEPFVARALASGSRRPPVNFARNEEALEPTEAKFLRFTVLASSSGEPCLDELEVWSGETNVALASRGAKASASSTLPGHEIHKLEHLNDGRYGNGRSWISHESGGGWAQLEFAQVVRIERVVWGRDREGRFKDRLPTKYRIEVATAPDAWRLVASSEDREPFRGGQKPAEREYRFDGWPKAQAEQGQAWLTELRQARKKRETAEKSAMIYAGQFSQPDPTHLLYRGDPLQKRELVPPGSLEIFQPLRLPADAPERERRLRLAHWIASAENPLTARVWVNRVWQHHFGVGLVDTPNDFGKNGARPTHPELLDWLASEFVESGWSVKKLQHVILTSATWRQSSAPREDALKIDAAGRLLWRFPPRRLEAEAIRDGILVVSGNLDRAMGGPSFYLHHVDRENVYHYHPKEDFGPEDSRRMVYAFKVRMEQDGIFGSFDCPDGSLVAPKRGVSTTPLQALNLFNSRFLLRQAEIFAERLRREAGDDVCGQVTQAWRLAFQRAPEKMEAREAEAFARAQGLPALCRALLNANEFLFVP